MLRFFLPGICVLCNQRCSRPYDLCSACEKELPWLHDCCSICAQPLPAMTPAGIICGKCVKQAPPFQRTIALFQYVFPVDLLITRLKFEQQLLYAKLLSQLLVHKISQVYQTTRLPELIVPVPLHKKRLQERGFNQAIEIARFISKKLHITVNKHDCIRHLHTLPQSSLPANARARNIKNAFSLRRPLKAKHIAIIDDVITTGQTVAALAKLLQKNGIEKIDIWCCARTAPFYQR